MRFGLPLLLCLSGILLGINALLVRPKPLPAQTETWIIFRSNRSGENAFYRMNLDGSHVVRLSGPISRTWHDMATLRGSSPDGEWFYYRTTDTLRAVRFDGRDDHGVLSNYIQLYPQASARYGPTICQDCGFETWTPNEQWMIYNQATPNGRELFRMLPDGQQKTQITHLKGNTAFLDWSPHDGRMLILNRGEQAELYTVALSGRDLHRVYISDYSINYLGWTADDWLWFGEYSYESDQTTWFRIRPDGSHRQVFNPLPYGVTSMVLSPDRRWFYGIIPHPEAPESTAVLRFAADQLNAPAHRITTLDFAVRDSFYDPLRWSEDGQWLIMRPINTYEQYRVRADGGYGEMISAGEYYGGTRYQNYYGLTFDLGTGPIWSADGAWMIRGVCCEISPYNGSIIGDWFPLISTHLPTGDTVSLSPHTRNRLFGFSPDGEWLLFLAVTDETATGEGCWELFRVRPDGSGLQNLTNSEGDDEFVAWIAPHPAREYPDESAAMVWVGGLMGLVGLGVMGWQGVKPIM